LHGDLSIVLRYVSRFFYGCTRLNKRRVFDTRIAAGVVSYDEIIDRSVRVFIEPVYKGRRLIPSRTERTRRSFCSRNVHETLHYGRPYCRFIFARILYTITYGLCRDNAAVVNYYPYVRFIQPARPRDVADYERARARVSREAK